MIAQWLLRRDWTILPAYEKFEQDFKGPRILSAAGNLIAPDMLVFKFGNDKGNVLWIEAKNKAAFTWYRKGNAWQDGIDKKCWTDYLGLCTLTPWPVWLLFLHGPGQVAKDTPPGKVPPTGLFGNRIDELATKIDHESDRHGLTGMVYWCEAVLPKIASWEEVSHDTPRPPPG